MNIQFLNTSANESKRGFNLTETFILTCINNGFKVWRNKDHIVKASKTNSDNVVLRFETSFDDDWKAGEPIVTVFENNDKIADFKISEFEIHD